MNKTDLIVTNENNCLLFSLGNKFYGINVENVLEIINLPKFDVPQKMPKHVLGIITYNNISVKIIDLYSILAHKSQKYSIDSQVLIVKTEESIFGLIIDKALDVISICSNNIQALPYHSEDNLIQYLYKIKDEFASVIDLNSVQNVVQKTQFETSNIDINELLPQDLTSTSIFEKRQLALLKKFEANIEQIYYDQEQYLIFKLNDNLYSLPIKNIREIVKLKSVSMVKLPSEYNYIEGVFNLRGDFISALDARKFLNIAEEVSHTEKTMLIVLELKDFKLALVADEIIDIVMVAANDIISKFDNKFESKYIVNELHLNEKPISIISIEKLIADERLYIKN